MAQCLRVKSVNHSAESTRRRNSLDMNRCFFICFPSGICCCCCCCLYRVPQRRAGWATQSNMSKIFINHNFKCLRIITLPDFDDDPHNIRDIPREMIELTCSSIDSESTAHLLNQISSTIITNELFTLPQSGKTTIRGTSRGRMMNGLIPVNSRLYANGSNTNEQPDIEIIKGLLEVKLKIDELENIEDENEDQFTIQPNQHDGSSEKLLTGHFRFHLPPMISPQLIILIKSPNQSDQISNQLLLFFHGNLKFLPVFTKYLQNQFNCAISDLNIGNCALKSCLNWSVLNDRLNTLGGIQLWFGKFQTKGKLGTILINIDEKDLFKFRDIYDQYYKEKDESEGNDTLSVLLFEYLSSQTQISFDKLTLIKLKCQLFTISVDGKVKFSPLMSHLGKKAKEAKGDERLSIWWIIRLLCSVK